MKLATIEKINKIKKHPNADKLEIVEVLGYQCVVPIGLHKEGDLVVYIQPDTVLPNDQEWAKEYLKYSPKRVKAVKLRGEFSEGVIVPLLKWGEENIINQLNNKDIAIGMEVSDTIGVTKYDPPLPNDCNFIGPLPYGISKTDEERVENISEENIPFGELVDITLKLDGQSTSHGFKVDEEKYFVTGRNFEINLNEENRYSIHAPTVKDKIIDYCKEEGVSLLFRGESYGSGIQNNNNNPHSKKPKSLAFFSIYNIDERKYERKGSKHYFVNVCEKLGLEYVNILEKDVVLTKELISKYSKELEKLPNGDSFEGVVINHKNGSFKIINKFYDSNK